MSAEPLPPPLPPCDRVRLPTLCWLRHRKAFPVLTHHDTETLPLSYLGTSQEPLPCAASVGHRKAVPALRLENTEMLPPRCLSVTQKGFPHNDLAVLERSRGATGHGPTCNIDKMSQVAMLEVSGAATWDFTCLSRKPKNSSRSPREIQDMDMPPT